MSVIQKVSGPLIVGENLVSPMMNEIVKIGDKELIGEVIRIFGDIVMIQAYEPTQGLAPGDKIVQTGEMFFLELGPGLLRCAFDGIQRPLSGESAYLKHGFFSKPLDRQKKWVFEPTDKLKLGDHLNGGEIIGNVDETNLFKHAILVPNHISGELIFLEATGEYDIEKVIAKVRTRSGIMDLKMYQKWPARVPRPATSKSSPTEILFTGLRVLDFFFPCAKGGTISVPGGFGTGKTQLIFQMLKSSEADCFVYVGCGERGNEVITVLDEISRLNIEGGILDDKAVYIINTSNMPVAARTASIFSGITIAEYFRDQGKKVVLLADSTTRWAEALREISNRMGEYPGEEGYPTYMASEIGKFYERAGNCMTLSGKQGGITVIGTISLYGSDYSDPVMQASLKVVSALWALDPGLAYVRHYPAINRSLSYSKYIATAKISWEKFGQWQEYYDKFLEILGKIQELEKLTAIMGKDMLAPADQFLLEFGSLFTEIFLKQSGFDDKDKSRDPEEIIGLAKLLLLYHDRGKNAVSKGIQIEEIVNRNIFSQFLGLKSFSKKNYLKKLESLSKEMVFAGRDN